ncbi:NTP/NDP exchange transporter [Candidatus Dependentiae bacterium]
MSDNKKYFIKTFEEERSNRFKFLFLALTFFLVIGAYTLIRDLKNAIFIGLVGKEYIPYARIMFPLILIPAVLFYSKLVDRVRRYYLLSFYSIFFAIMCLIFAFFVGHPVIGIANTDQSPYRLFGWLFFFFVEGFSPFVLGVFWAFSNSINTPKSAKKNYGFMVSGSQLGGMFTAGFAWALFSLTSFPVFGVMTDVSKMRLILVFASLLLFAVPLVIKLLMVVIPGKHLHGYEAAYKVEKERGKAGKAKTGMFAGLKMLIKYPYVLGIFSMVFLYEVLNSILSYLRLGVAQQQGKSIVGISAFLFKWVFIMQAVGLVISLLGTSSLLRKLGTRTCVGLIPIIMGAGALCFIFTDVPFIVMTAFTLMKSVNYAFSKPVVESLYIPTLKEIKFKSKSWIDAFGSKLAKTMGSGFNGLAEHVKQINFAMFGPMHAFAFAIIIGIWAISAFFLGKRFDSAIESNEVIGLEKERLEPKN